MSTSPHDEEPRQKLGGCGPLIIMLIIFIALAIFVIAYGIYRFSTVNPLG